MPRKRALDGALLSVKSRARVAKLETRGLDAGEVLPAARGSEESIGLPDESPTDGEATATGLDNGGAEDDFALADVPSDTLAAVMMLRNKFPPSVPMCPLALKTHIYSVVNDRTAVDRQLEELNRNNKVQIIKLASNRNDYGVALWEDYASAVCACGEDRRALSGGEEGIKGASELFGWFLDSLVARISHCYVTDFQMERELRAFLASVEGADPNAYDEHITLLIRSGLLTRRTSVHGGYWISVPNVGIFVKSLNTGRKRLLGIVRRRKRGEMLQWDLEKVKLPKTTLGMPFHLRDALGSGIFDQIETTCGPLLRLANKKQSEDM
mmetsp:Transcript_8958/g.22079  ORF Transcript_8958/g.22079 Transcript_8958/m.22079 type:complete len:325 (+) Transcript_8958:240-1214(+)